MTIDNLQRKDAIRFSALPPLSLYIHFPWCVKKCPYCDFNSHEIKAGQTNGFDEATYLNALRLDLETTLPLVWGRRIHSIFIGGGTPSLLSAAGMDQLLADIRARLPMDADIEITMEANPGTVEADKFSSYAQSGINRISLGIQSFNDEMLTALGRIHNQHDAKRAIEIAHRHFNRINLDLMYALPNQSIADAALDLKTAIDFDTNHLSLYHLTLEPNTLFAKFPPKVPDDDTAFDMQDTLLLMLEDAGFNRYEISAFSKPKQACQHNLNYWSFGDYIGIGAGAHGKISFPDKIIRTVKEKHPQHYMQKMLSESSALIEERNVSASELPFEFMLNALRLIDGVPTDLFSERTGLSLHRLSSKLAEASQKKLLDDDPSKLKATALGLQYLNDLQAIFL